MIDEKYDDQLRVLIKLFKKNGYPRHMLNATFVICYGDDNQETGVTGDYLDKAIELAKQSLSEHDFNYEFMKYVDLKEGLGWED